MELLLRDDIDWNGENPEDIYWDIEVYLRDFELQGEPFPTLCGLALALDIPKPQLMAWAADPDRPKFSAYIERMASMRELNLIKGSFSGQYPPTVAKLVLSEFGYTDRQVHEVKNEITVRQHNIPLDLDPKEASRMYQELLGPPT